MTGRWGMGLAAALVLVASGCGGHPAPRPEPATSTSSSVAPAYDPSLPPARAVLALVPHAATTLSLTDFDRVRAEYGAEPGDAGFWKRAVAHSPLLSTDMLRPVAGRLRGFTPDAVAWEAHYATPDGSGPDGSGPSGWVLGFAPRTDMGAVQRAVAAGIGPLAGASVDAADHLVTSARLAPTDPRWTDLASLVGPEEESMFLARGCVAGDTEGQRLQPLTGYGLDLGQSLATAYLGPNRDDLFTRMRLGAGGTGGTGGTAGAGAFSRPSADPRTGRIGLTMTDPAAAARQVLRRALPFAICAG